MRQRILVTILGVLIAVLAIGHFGRVYLTSQPMHWAAVKMDLPPSIRVFADSGVFQGQARAWYADLDYTDKTLHAVPYLSCAPSGRETASVMCQTLGALVAINGGYFDMLNEPAPTFSLVMRGGKNLVPNIAVVHRANPARAYSVTRSAFGIRADRSFDVAWIAKQGDALWSYPRPVAHTVTGALPAPTKEAPPGGKGWDAVDAIGAGPTLISDGVIQDTYENEVFFDAGFPNNEPYGRAAVGFTKAGHLILFATDSRALGGGISLPQLAQEMQRLGCVEAMNLDSGGSETLVVKGKALNQPADVERAVTSVLSIVPEPKSAVDMTAPLTLGQSSRSLQN